MSDGDQRFTGAPPGGIGHDGALSGYAIVAGFGIPGRAVATLFERAGVPFCVVELNGETVRRCGSAGLTIFQGDIADEAVMRRAGIERATVLALAIPDDAAVLRTIPIARRLNPHCRLFVRCRRVSTALAVNRMGIHDVLSEEQVVAQAFEHMIEPLLPASVEQSGGGGRNAE